VQGQKLALEMKVCAVCAPLAQVGGGLVEGLLQGLVGGIK
jgi:hypothetical protein